MRKVGQLGREVGSEVVENNTWLLSLSCGVWADTQQPRLAGAGGMRSDGNISPLGQTRVEHGLFKPKMFIRFGPN